MYPEDRINQVMSEKGAGLGAHSITVRDRLNQRKKEAEYIIATVNRAIELLDKNPDMEEFTNITRLIL